MSSGSEEGKDGIPAFVLVIPPGRHPSHRGSGAKVLTQIWAQSSCRPWRSFSSSWVQPSLPCDRQGCHGSRPPVSLNNWVPAPLTGGSSPASFVTSLQIPYASQERLHAPRDPQCPLIVWRQALTQCLNGVKLFGSWNMRGDHWCHIGYINQNVM